jgi:hypothetical protein
MLRKRHMRSWTRIRNLQISLGKARLLILSQVFLNRARLKSRMRSLFRRLALILLMRKSLNGNGYAMRRIRYACRLCMSGKRPSALKRTSVAMKPESNSKPGQKLATKLQIPESRSMRSRKPFSEKLRLEAPKSLAGQRWPALLISKKSRMTRIGQESNMFY